MLLEKLWSIQNKISTKNSPRSKLKIIWEFGHSWYCWKALNDYDLEIFGDQKLWGDIEF
jgi:hypothetical protein